MSEKVEIDGSYGEAGGQVLRTALSLSALTGRPTVIESVRAGRSKPGLMPQHLTGVLAMADICGAKFDGARLGSTEVEFEPGGAVRPGEYTFDIAGATHGGSAGSVTLLLQSLLLPLALSPGPSSLTLMGGTHVAWSPTFEFMTGVLFPILSRMGLNATARLVSWGFYPKGGGRINVDIEPVETLAPVTLIERGELKLIHGRAIACNLKSHIAVRMINRSRNILTALEVPVKIDPERVKAKSAGAVLFIAAEYEHLTAGFSAMGEPHKPSERVAEEACGDLVEHHENGSPCPARLADQLLLPAALANGRSEIHTSRITTHLLTNAHVIEQFLPVKIEIDGDENRPGVIVVDNTRG